VIDDLGLRPMIRFNTEIARANWDEAAALWR
jgi:cation diffusion facilitator CzcD-associated flavoprotein CzcO